MEGSGISQGEWKHGSKSTVLEDCKLSSTAVMGESLLPGQRPVGVGMLTVSITFDLL